MPRKKIIADRHERIVQAADSLFNHYGFEKTTMEDISRESGIPRATIYLEFPSGKGDIMMASIKRHLAKLLSDMRALAQQPNTSTLDVLRQIVVHNIMTNYDRTVEVQYEPNNLELYSKRVREEVSSYFQERTVLHIELLTQASQRGEISQEHDPAHLAELIALGQRAFMPPLTYQLDRETLKKNADAFFKLFLNGIANSACITA